MECARQASELINVVHNAFAGSSDPLKFSKHLTPSIYPRSTHLRRDGLHSPERGSDVAERGMTGLQGESNGIRHGLRGRNPHQAASYSSPLHRQEALCFENPQSLAQRRTAHLKFFQQFILLGQKRTVGDFAFDNSLPATRQR